MKDFRSRFGFHTTPFTREIPVQERFRLPPSEEALEALVQTVEERMSAALIAPAGTGKTALLRALVARLPEARYRTHYVKVTGLSKRDMCREMAMAAGATPAGSFPMLVRRLQEHFVQTCEGEGLRSVMILDEAHDLRPEVLAMIRVLTNFEMDSRLVVAIVLAGQEPLRRLLQRDDLDDVAKRLAHYATLRSLSREETQSYVDHRCRIAGADSVPFDASAIDALYEIGRGNLRATDRLALKSLQIAHDHKADVCDQNVVASARKAVSP
jgi:general secretion pathway protein A